MHIHLSFVGMVLIRTYYTGTKLNFLQLHVCVTDSRVDTAQQRCGFRFSSVTLVIPASTRINSLIFKLLKAKQLGFGRIYQIPWPSSYARFSWHSSGHRSKQGAGLEYLASLLPPNHFS